MIKAYYQLSKPGIVYSNALTAVAGFLLAAKGHGSFGLFLAMLAGLSLVIASACVFNNYMDMGIDSKMSRTKKRPLVTQQISGVIALFYATFLGLLGFALLLFFTNLLTTVIAFVGFFFYLIMYGISKRKSEYGTLVGSISGAVPPVVGYCAITNHMDLGAWLLFLVLVVWQMPHFYAIAIFRKEDYAAAAIPVWPVKKGVHGTKIQILLYVVAFLIVSALLTIFHYTGYVYLVILLFSSLIWLILAIKGFTISDEKKWARKMFFFSLFIIVIFSLMLSVNNFLL